MATPWRQPTLADLVDAAVISATIACLVIAMMFVVLPSIDALADRMGFYAIVWFCVFAISAPFAVYYIVSKPGRGD